MLDDRARAEVLAIFRAELEDHCQALSRLFLALEREPGEPERARGLADAFRIAHTIKGAADAAGQTATATLAHCLEDALAEAREGRLTLAPFLFDALYAAVDAFEAFDQDDPDAAGPARIADVANRLRAARDDQPVSPANQPDASSQSGLVPPSGRTGSADRTEQARTATGRGETIRLPAARLDQLLDQLSELVIPRMEASDGLTKLEALRVDVEAWHREWRKARALARQLEQHAKLPELRPLLRFLELNERNLVSLGARFGTLQPQLAGATDQLATMTGRLLADTKRFRMVQFGQHAAGLDRVVRDTARTLGKDARLVVRGADVELDRWVLEQVRDPLLHLLRNAVDHGLEDAAERQRRDKSKVGTVTVAAAQRGATMVIEVSDDGRGADAPGLRRAALERALVSESDAAEMDDEQALRLMFLPGLSTSDSVSEVSGRGVGLEVVARGVEQAGGRIKVEATPGQGTRFIITLPLTLTNTRAVLVEVGDAPYALPTTAVERVLIPKQLGVVGGRPALEYEGAVIPVLALRALLRVDGDSPHAGGDRQPILALLSAGGRRVAVAVDRVLGEEEIVVKPLGFPLLRPRYFAGATILGSGRVVPILNATDLVQASSTNGGMYPETSPTDSVRPSPRVLVVDDSLTTRTLERYILEAAGYQVMLAADGVQALELLHDESCDVLVSDIDMPELDGIALTAKVRGDPKLRDLRVVLVTALESAEDRERGLHAGADAYIVKSSFDQDSLLRTIEDLVC